MFNIFNRKIKYDQASMFNPLRSDVTHKLTFVNPQGRRQTIEVYEDEYITDAAARQGVNLPSSCNTGLCVSCTAKLLDGSIVHDHSFLKAKEEKAGFLLTCHTFATSDCVILTHQEEALLEV